MENAVAVSFRTIMHGPYRDHPSEEALERFLMHNSDEDELELVETHILACEACISRLETLELTLKATKLVLQDYLAESASQPVHPVRSSKTSAWLTIPRLSLIGASLAACAVGFFIAVPHNVSMTAERGNDSVSASAWVPLTLHLNADALPSGPVKIEVVNDLGGILWHGNSSVTDGAIVVAIPRLTSFAAQFFVRVYSADHPSGNRADNASPSTLLREYSLQTKSIF